MGTPEFVAGIAAVVFSVVIFSLSVAALASTDCQSRGKDLVIAIAVISGLPIIGLIISVPVMLCIFIKTAGHR